MSTDFFTDRDLDELRDLQVSAMSDKCRIVHPDAAHWDDVTGEFGTPGLTLLYQGRCRIAPSSRSQMALGQEATPWFVTEVYLPHDAPTPRVDDLITIEKSRDPDLVGRTMRIRDVRFSTNNASRKLMVESIARGQQSPEV